MQQLIENTKAYKDLEGFKQEIIMKRSNRIQIEQAVVTARAIGYPAWANYSNFSSSWKAIVKEVLNG